MEEKYFGWQATLLTLPVVYLVYRSYSSHLERLESARKHAQEMGDLHWRTIEALALAIDAKDETTHNHLLRVKVYATEIAKEALDSGRGVYDLVLGRGLMTREELDLALNPEAMTAPR